jgi:hypothetical protein
MLRRIIYLPDALFSTGDSSSAGAWMCWQGEGNGLAVVWGRRRIGKSRLLVEWARKHGGLYVVADQSAPGMQRRYLAQSVATRLSGFDAVEYPDWATLLTRWPAKRRRRDSPAP